MPAASEPVVRSRPDVVPDGARVELDRIRRRWSALPIERAEAGMPVLRNVLAHLATRSADPPPAVPDLGPAVAVDQLSVLVWDAYAAGRGDDIPDLLGAARRELG